MTFSASRSAGPGSTPLPAAPRRAMLGSMATIASAADFRAAARRRLPRFLFDYIDGAAYAEVTAGRNLSDLAQVALRQRVLRDVSSIDLSTNLLGRDLAMPIALCPVGLAGMYARRGEAQAARAATGAGVPFCL
jgi:L-lactate dehydrogenase (cytochrome)